MFVCWVIYTRFSLPTLLFGIEREAALYIFYISFEWKILIFGFSPSFLRVSLHSLTILNDKIQTLSYVVSNKRVLYSYLLHCENIRLIGWKYLRLVHLCILGSSQVLSVLYYF